MVTAVKPALAGEFRIVPIATVEVEKDFNNRRSLGDVSELADSIKSLGLLEPLIVWQPNGNGRLRLIAGERRLAAAKQAGLKQIPVIVKDLDDKERLEALLVENLMRKDIDPLEEADGYRRLLALGEKQKDIAARVGRSEAHVSKRLALANLSPLTAKLVGAGTIPIDSAIALAKYKPEHQDAAIKHVERSYGKLENAEPYQLRNLGDRARDEAKKAAMAQKKAALKKKLKTDGVAIVSAQNKWQWGEAGHPWQLGKASNQHRGSVAMTPKQHSEFPCHAAAVTGDMWTEPKVTYLCTDPTSHMAADERVKYKKKIADGKRDTYGEQRSHAEEVRKQVAHAREARLPAIREQLKAFDRPTLLKLALEGFVMQASNGAVAEVLGLEAPKGKGIWDVVAAYCNASEANLVRAAAAVAIDEGERALSDLTYAHAGSYYFNGQDLPQAVAIAAWFKQSQIELSEVENKALDKAAKK